MERHLSEKGIRLEEFRDRDRETLEERGVGAAYMMHRRGGEIFCPVLFVFGHNLLDNLNSWMARGVPKWTPDGERFESTQLEK